MVPRKASYCLYIYYGFLEISDRLLQSTCHTPQGTEINAIADLWSSGFGRKAPCFEVEPFSRRGMSFFSIFERSLDLNTTSQRSYITTLLLISMSLFTLRRRCMTGTMEPVYSSRCLARDLRSVETETETENHTASPLLKSASCSRTWSTVPGLGLRTMLFLGLFWDNLHIIFYSDCHHSSYPQVYEVYEEPHRTHVG